METKEKHRLMVGANYKPSIRRALPGRRFLDVGLGDSSDGVGAISGSLMDFSVL